jgi:hypothetical protein
VPWNSTYYAEVWLRDTGTIRGIVGGSVDLAYTTAVTDATEIDHGSQYNLFTSGTIDDPHGLVNNLGGGTLDSGEGTTQWVRLATTTFTSVATGDALFSVGHDLAPGSVNWQFAEMGAGNLDWSRVHFNSTPVTVHHAPLTVVNDPPVAIGDTWTVQENQTLAVGVPGVLSNDGDVNGDALSAVLVHSTTHGALQLHADGSFTYAPAEWFNREDSFQYYVDDGTDRSGTVTVTLVVQTAYPWHNGIQRFDVNDDGDISPSDVLTVINELNAKDNSKPLSLDRPRPLAVPFLDVSQDGYVSAQDALWVINYLNGRRSGEGEGEVPDATSVAGPMLLPEAPRIAFPRTLTRTSPSPTATTRGSMARYVIGQLPEIGFVATESIAEPGFWDEPDHNWMLPDLDSTLSEIADDLVEQWAVDEDGYPDRFRTNGRQCWRTPTLALSAER